MVFVVAAVVEVVVRTQGTVGYIAWGSEGVRIVFVLVRTGEVVVVHIVVVVTGRTGYVVVRTAQIVIAWIVIVWTDGVMIAVVVIVIVAVVIVLVEIVQN